jgi:hypothetical protein
MEHEPIEREVRPTRRRLLTSPLVWGVVFLMLLGGSFAASISINAGEPAEFGQGVQEIAACDGVGTAVGDPGITISLGSEANVLAVPEPQFDVTNVFLTDIDVACEGKYLKLGLYAADGSLIDDIVFYMNPTLLDALSAPFRAAALAAFPALTGCSDTSEDFPDGNPPVPGQDCWAASGANYELLDTIAAEDVSYVTIESSDNPPSAAL